MLRFGAHKYGWNTNRLAPYPIISAANRCRRKTVAVSYRHFGNLSRVEVTISSIFQTAVSPVQEKDQTCWQSKLQSGFFSAVGNYLVSSFDCLKCSCPINIPFLPEQGSMTVTRGYGKRIRRPKLCNGKVSVVKQAHLQLMHCMTRGHSGRGGDWLMRKVEISIFLC